MAVIRINDLKVRTIIGAHPWERVNQQDLVVHISIEYDASKACRSDALGDTINYEAVAQRVVKTIKRSRYTLLEKLANRILADIMSNRKVQWAFVRVDKPHAIPEARCVSFEISAERLPS